MEQKKNSLLKRTTHTMFVNYFNHNVGKNAAALAYYLLFALFPLLIFMSNLLGLLNLNVYSITQFLGQFLPADIVVIAESYLDYISHNSSHTLLWFALVFSIWFPMRAAKGLMDDVRRAYGLGIPKNLITYTVKQLIYTLIFLLVIALTLFLTVMGENVLSFINDLLPDTVWQLSDYLLGIWQYLRFLPVAVLMFLAIIFLYAVALERRQPVKEVLPGIFAALFGWMIVSIGFSFYAENFANYSLIYGTLGAVIVLLIWLYLSALILILGAELNATLYHLRNETETNE